MTRAGAATAAPAWGYQPALDGLRALAITGVLLTHAGYSRLLGAAHGVTVFFVVSGYLITSLLLRERERTGDIRLLAFYRRRFARLMPAFLVAILVTTSYLLATGHPWREFWQGPVYSCLYVINLAGAFGAVPDTASHYYIHNWSLAIEEQFYFVWPLVTALVLGRRQAPGEARPGRIRALAIGCLLVVGLAHLSRLLLTADGAAFERMKFGTETRIDAIMLGCLLALLLRSARLRAWCSRHHAALLALATLVMAVVVVQGAVVRLDPGGYLAAGLASAATIAALVTAPAGRAARWLATPAVVWLGRRSYSLYLWNVLAVEIFLSHWPSKPGFTWLGPVWLLASLALADVSYRLVEVPLRQRLSGRSGSASRPAPARGSTPAPVSIELVESSGLAPVAE